MIQQRGVSIRLTFNDAKVADGPTLNKSLVKYKFNTGSRTLKIPFVDDKKNIYMFYCKQKGSGTYYISAIPSGQRVTKNWDYETFWMGKDEFQTLMIGGPAIDRTENSQRLHVQIKDDTVHFTFLYDTRTPLTIAVYKDYFFT